MFYFLLKKYLFIYLSASGLHQVMLDLSLRHMDFLVVAHELSSCRAWVPELMGFSINRCSLACGILVP